MLVSIRWDGTDEKEHVKVEGPTPAGATDGLRPTRIVMAPRGDQALVEPQRNVYTVTVPPLGAAPTINVSNPENAAFPARRLTDLGGEFPAWSAHGRTVHWPLGNAWFSYDLDEARAFEERQEAAEEEEADDEAAADEPADTGPDEDADAGADAEDSDEAVDAEDAEEDNEFRAAEVRVVIDAARDLPEGVAVLRGGRAVAMSGEEVIDDADIVVRGPRIEAVGPRGSVDVPVAGAVLVGRGAGRRAGPGPLSGGTISKSLGMTPTERVVLDTSAYSRLRSGHVEVTERVVLAPVVVVPVTVLGELDAGFELGRPRA